MPTRPPRHHHVRLDGRAGHCLKAAIAASVMLVVAAPASAQSLGGVFGPVVKEGSASAQWRSGYDPDAERWGHRVHYQQALNDKVQVRGLVQVRETADSDFDFDSLGLEATWQITPDGQHWQTGLRFDARVRDDGRPGSLGVNWMNQWALPGGWRARGLVLTAVDVGDNTRDGVFVQTRGQLNYRLAGGPDVGLELFSAYGSSDNFRDFEDQSHEIGPYVVAPVAENWSIFAGTLFGLTDGSPDANLKFWLTRGF